MAEPATLESVERAIHELTNAVTAVILQLEGVGKTLGVLEDGVREIKAVLPPLVRTLEALDEMD